jgi:uridine phosphorylase
MYHIDMLPTELAQRVVLVGDPGRVGQVEKHFQRVICAHQHREFVWSTGIYQGKEITALSTGIGTDNIDIVVNELDALASIDLAKRQPLPEGEVRKLKLVRLGTCGLLQPYLPVGSFVLSRYALGFDALMHFYKVGEAYETYQLRFQLKNYFDTRAIDLPFYVSAPQGEFDPLLPGRHLGITASLPGFYGPQGRLLNCPVRFPEFIEELAGFGWEGLSVLNFEMEASGLFGLASALGHESACVCLGLANRITGEVLRGSEQRMNELIELVLNGI